VAFANTYGGVIIIGNAETDEKPPRAKDFGDPLVRNCIDCVERLGPALRSLFDPPIAGFDIRAIRKLFQHLSGIWDFAVGHPEEPLGLRGIASELSRDRSLLSLPSLRSKNGSPVNPLFGWGHPNWGWQPSAHAARAEQCFSHSFGLWTISDDGLVDITGLSLPSDNRHYPGWFSTTVAPRNLVRVGSSANYP
jgi:hypothetical protein